MDDTAWRATGREPRGERAVERRPALKAERACPCVRPAYTAPAMPLFLALLACTGTKPIVTDTAHDTDGPDTDDTGDGPLGDPSLVCQVEMVCPDGVEDEPKHACDLRIVSGDGAGVYDAMAMVEIAGAPRRSSPSPPTRWSCTPRPPTCSRRVPRGATSTAPHPPPTAGSARASTTPPGPAALRRSGTATTPPRRSTMETWGVATRPPPGSARPSRSTIPPPCASSSSASSATTPPSSGSTAPRSCAPTSRPTPTRATGRSPPCRTSSRPSGPIGR